MSGWGMVQESPTSCIHRQKFASRAIFGFQKFPRKFASLAGRFALKVGKSSIVVLNMTLGDPCGPVLRLRPEIF